MTWGLEKYGQRTMLIGWCITVAILSVPAIYFLRERIAPQVGHGASSGSFNFIRTPMFALLQAGNILQALGNFLPGIYLPSEFFGLPRLQTFPACKNRVRLLLTPKHSICARIRCFTSWLSYRCVHIQWCLCIWCNIDRLPGR